MAKKSKVLQDVTSIINLLEPEDIENIEMLEPDVLFIQNINDNASLIVDERINGYVLHSLESVLLLVIFAIIANCNTFTEIYFFGSTHFDWLNKYIKFESGLPSLSTIKRVISFINPRELEELLVQSVSMFNNDNKPIYQLGLFQIEDIKSTDGKVANSSGRENSKNGKISKTNAMSVYSLKNQICEATEFISDKTNEIPTCPEMLKRLNIKNNIIVFDALNTQVDTIKYIFNEHGYYVAPIKGNHKILFEELIDYFNDEDILKEIKTSNYKKIIEKRNGDADIREYGFINDINWIYNHTQWLGIKSIGFAKRTYKNKQGKIVSDIRYYISNINAKYIDVIAMAIRGEWRVENNLHYYLDMVFKEDDSKSFVKNTQKNLNIIRKFSLTLLKKYKEKTKLSMNSIRFLTSMNFEKEIVKILTI